MRSRGPTSNRCLTSSSSQSSCRRTRARLSPCSCRRVNMSSPSAIRWHPGHCRSRRRSTATSAVLPRPCSQLHRRKDIFRVRVGKVMRRGLAFAALLGVAATARAGFKEDYVAGLKALDQGRIAEAQKYLQHAFDAQPNPVDKIDLDGNSQPYLPLHFLGVAAYRLGDCTAAANYWGIPLNRRMVDRLTLLLNQEQQLQANCKPATVTAAAEPAPPPATLPESSTSGAVSAAKPLPPDALVQALQNYLGGRYAVATRIDPAGLSDPRAKFHAYLIRSAANFMLANTGGDAVFIEAARADARAAHALDARTQPDVATFPPRFRAFYNETH